ncbi:MULTISPECIES: SGNH/GDSL hydrolase family protein [unclassified Arthrobacter]|uniref:SGNH/GDSL hydrolase family protein n=1 Tax=unclassified Arthrobacter TaxID=235627 RepID=UPI001319C0CB|nr:MULTISPECIES: SGNH/GDSL hydrolase family protein [unclassified Arthrobacter]MDT0196973.1 SGNH/GDSL hydrolase family protein [Arthrobacter sp. AB6]
MAGRGARSCRGIAGRLGLLAAVVTGLVAGSVAAPAAAQAPAPLDYVALGDSYTSGIGASPNVTISPLYPAGLQPCYQASPGYADVLDAQDDVQLTANAACAGWTAAMVPMQVHVASAAGVLNAETDLVTITAGGNDVGFGNLLGACMRYPLDICAAEVKAAESVAQAVVLPALTAAYAAIRAQAPNARIVALGYPHLFSPEVGANGYITNEAAKVFNKGTDTLNKVIKEAAKKSPGTVYVSVTDEFAGHGVGLPGSWFFFDPADPFNGMNFHPNATGYALGYADAIIREAKVPALSK